MAAKKSQKGDEKGTGFQASPSDSRSKKKESASSNSAAKAQNQKPVSSCLAGSKPKYKPTPAKNAQGIPEQVSQRMVRRMALFCGVPTGLGLASFPTGYFILQQGIELPNVAVLLVSLGFLGLGVLGLTYGVLSASWDEETPGDALGWSEFKLNLGRTLESWKEVRERNQP